MTTSTTGERRIVYKVLKAAEWRDAVETGGFAGSADDLRDGFIHLSTAEQLAGTLRKHFFGQGDLVLVSFRTEDLGEQLRWEASRGGDLFPHLYGPLPASKALETQALVTAADGEVKMPEGLSS